MRWSALQWFSKWINKYAAAPVSYWEESPPFRGMCRMRNGYWWGKR